MNSWGLKTRILAGIGIALGLLILLGGLGIFSLKSMQEGNHWVDHTNRVLAEAVAIVGSVVDMETGMRGCLLAGKEDLLAPYRHGEKATDEQIASLKQTVNDNSVLI